MEIAQTHHGEKANVFPKVFEHRENIEQIIRRRSYITDAEHRFFLALLMNVEGKNQIFSLIKERFPDNDAIEKVLDWTLDLAQTKVLGENVPNALGIENFDDIDLLVFEWLLKDKNIDEMKAALQSDFPNEDVSAVAETIPDRTEKIKSAGIFKPFFA
jgi:hypothetical protein